jgi:hypothetical protein
VEHIPIATPNPRTRATAWCRSAPRFLAAWMTSSRICARFSAQLLHRRLPIPLQTVECSIRIYGAGRRRDPWGRLTRYDEIMQWRARTKRGRPMNPAQGARNPGQKARLLELRCRGWRNQVGLVRKCFFKLRLRFKTYDELAPDSWIGALPTRPRAEQTIWEVFEEERPKLIAYLGRFDGFHA